MGYKPLSQRESVRNNDDDCDNSGTRVHNSGSSSSESQRHESSSSSRYRRVKHTTRRHYYEEEEEEEFEEEKKESSESTHNYSSSYNSVKNSADGGGCRPKITQPRRKLGCTTGYDGGNNSSTGRPRRPRPVYEISGSAYADDVASDFDPSGQATTDGIVDGYYVPRRKVVMRSRDFELPVAAAAAREIKHFGHKDALGRHDVEVGDDVYCAICEIEVNGKCYGCKDCGFFIHKSCFRLPREIQHDSHVDHALELIPSPAPYKCVSCCELGYGFVYECSICKFDLDVICAGSPSTLQCEEHENELKLRYEYPIDSNESVVMCEICKEEINRDGWVYFNDESGFIAHTGCAFNKEAKDMITALENRLVDMELE